MTLGESLSAIIVKPVVYRKMRFPSRPYILPFNGNERVMDLKDDGDYIPAGVVINFDVNGPHCRPPDIIQVRVEND